MTAKYSSTSPGNSELVDLHRTRRFQLGGPDPYRIELQFQLTGLVSELLGDTAWHRVRCYHTISEAEAASARMAKRYGAFAVFRVVPPNAAEVLIFND